VTSNLLIGILAYKALAFDELLPSAPSPSLPFESPSFLTSLTATGSMKGGTTNA